MIDLLEQCCSVGVIVLIFDDTIDDSYRMKISDKVAQMVRATKRGDVITLPIMIVAHDGKQYSTVSYKEITLFTMKTLPWKIQCGLNRTVVCDPPDSPVVLLCDSRATDDMPGFSAGESFDIDVSLDISDDSDLDMDTLSNPTMENNSFIYYIALNEIPNWRKQLADDWVCDVSYEGRNWKSVYHYMAAIPFRKYPEYYSVFSSDSKSDVSVDPTLIQKHIASLPKVIKPSIQSNDILNDSYEKITREKFKQNSDLMRTLKLTRSATLCRPVDMNDGRDCHTTPKKININTVLMSIRDTDQRSV